MMKIRDGEDTLLRTKRMSMRRKLGELCLNACLQELYQAWDRAGGGSCYFWVPLSPSGKGKGNRAPGCKISKLTSVEEQRI